MISQEALSEFKRIWQEEEGETISDEIAMEQAINMLTLFNAIYKPIKKEWLDESLEMHPQK